MASPFPGMDPYLESPQFWRGVHALLIAEINGELNRQLPPGYAADIDERLFVARPGEENAVFYPDVTLSRPRPVVPDRILSQEESGSAGAATAVADRAQATEPEIARVDAEVRQRFITIFRVQQPREIVTIIEVLSPSNKAQGSTGWDSYLTKQQETMQSDTHLLEIDLLRRGAHTVVTPSEYIRRAGVWNYPVSLNRADRRYTHEFWRIRLREALPRVYVPLAGPDADIVLDLQTVFARVYAGGPYARRIDYAQQPDVPLEGEDAAWADALLRGKGLRR